MTRVDPPYAGLSQTSIARPPFRTITKCPWNVIITMRVTGCRKPPRNDALPFREVTLRNTHAMEERSFIRGERYAHAPSSTLQVARSNDFVPGSDTTKAQEHS
jgi:hypothetical protein